MDTSDPFGLYRLLGLTPSASMEEIKATDCRRPYYIPSGDESDKAFAEAFRRTPEAYAVLSDPARRANYDWFARNLPAEAIEPDGSIRYDLSLIPDGLLHCSLCGQITLQPRYITLSYMGDDGRGYGRQVVDRETLLCVNCVEVARLRRDLDEPVSGKIGYFNRRHPIYRFYALFKVWLGEKHDRLTDAKLILHNVRALLEQGDIRTAYGLAKLFRKSGDERIANEAAQIIRIIDASGADTSGWTIKDDWSLSEEGKQLYRLMGFIVPAVVIFAVHVYNAQGNAVPAKPAMVDGVAAVFCAHPPEEGVLAPQTKTGGDLTLRIRNTSLQDAVVKVRDRTSAVVASAFLKRNGSIDITDLPSDDYKIQFQLGYRLDATCKGFSTEDAFEKNDPGKTMMYGGRKIIEYKLVAFGSANRRLFKTDFLNP